MSNRLSCSVARDLMPQYVEGLLSPESEAELAAHLKECEACREICRQMNSPEPIPLEAVREVDYLKKVKRERIRLLFGSAMIIAAILLGCGFFLRTQRAISKQYAAQADKYAEKASEYAEIASEYAALVSENAEQAEEQEGCVSYDPDSRIVIVFGRGDDVNVEFPAELAEAKNLDAQFQSFRVSVYLPMLETDEPLDRFLSDFLERTNRSIKFLRSYLHEKCTDPLFADRVNKYVEISVMKHETHEWTEHNDRISLEMGNLYWYRDLLYLLTLLDSQSVEWKELGFAWYVGCCVNPYSEFSLHFDELQNSPCYEAYLRCGGTLEDTPENKIKMNDAAAYTCLERGMRWGASYESFPLKNTALFGGTKYNADPGNEMSISMAASLIGYLVQNYGIDRVSAFCFGQSSFAEAFGTDFDSAYAAWADWVRAYCGTN